MAENDHHFIDAIDVVRMIRRDDDNFINISKNIFLSYS